jgi:glycosyltransferase involved in cell wall biosynthesis
MHMPAADTWIVIPAYNESPVVAEVVTSVRSRFRNVVVVDDCSDDGTGGYARAAGASVIRHAINLGQGAALQTGIGHALAHGARFIVTFDADGQHRVEDIAIMQDRQRETGADVVIGSRFLGAAQGIPPLRRFWLRTAVIFSRLTTGVRLTDAHNGLRLLTRDAAERIRIRQNRMAHASEIIHRIGELRLIVAEAPVTIVYSEYSLRKGQRVSNAINIAADLIIARLRR